jgi:hypothetical protein
MGKARFLQRAFSLCGLYKALGYENYLRFFPLPHPPIRLTSFPFQLLKNMHHLDSFFN